MCTTYFKEGFCLLCRELDFVGHIEWSVLLRLGFGPEPHQLLLFAFPFLLLPLLLFFCLASQLLSRLALPVLHVTVLVLVVLFIFALAVIFGILLRFIFVHLGLLRDDDLLDRHRILRFALPRLHLGLDARRLLPLLLLSCALRLLLPPLLVHLLLRLRLLELRDGVLDLVRHGPHAALLDLVRVERVALGRLHPEPVRARDGGLHERLLLLLGLRLRSGRQDGDLARHEREGGHGPDVRRLFGERIEVVRLARRTWHSW